MAHSGLCHGRPGTAAVAPNADLVAWSRIGAGYQSADLTRALEQDRTLFELRGFVRPTSVVALHVPETPAYLRRPPGAPDVPPGARHRHRVVEPHRRMTQRRVQEWLVANDSFRRDVVARLSDAGPLLSRDVPDTAQVSWGSTGWTNNRNVTQMLELLSARGEVAVAGRVGRQRLWDLADRVYPAFEPLPPAESQWRREKRRLRAQGIVRTRTLVLPEEPTSVGTAGMPVTVEGLDGTWWVDPDALDQPFTGRTALLSPFDRLMVHPLHEDVPFSPKMRADVDAEVEALADSLQLKVSRT